jgi:hypothetical protein
MTDSISHEGVGQTDPGRPGNVINSGMQISGGTFSGPVAGGYGAHAAQVNQGMDAQRLARLERLLQEIEIGASSLDGEQQVEAIVAVRCLREEVHAPVPDAGRIRRLLGRLTAQVTSVAALLDVVNQAKDLIGPLLH